jgi:hypothetical protein
MHSFIVPVPMPNKWLVALIARLLKPSVANKVASPGMKSKVKVINNQSFYKILWEPITN